MLEERTTEASVDQDRVEQDGPVFHGEFGQLVMQARERQERYRSLVDQLAYALRIAAGPEALDRATIPLALPLGPAKVKELSAQVRLSPYLRANLQALIAIYRAERDELRRLERAAELAEVQPALYVSAQTRESVQKLFTWLEAARERFREYPNFYELLVLPRDGESLLTLVPRAMPDDLADCFEARPATGPLTASKPEAKKPGWRDLIARLGGAPAPAKPQEVPGSEDLRNPENVLKLMGVRPLTVKLGLGLIKQVDPALGGDLMERVIPMRVSIGLETGYVMPGVAFQDDLTLPEQGYQLLVGTAIAARGEVLPGFVLAIPDADSTATLPGFPAHDPASGREAYWIPRTLSALARAAEAKLLEANDVVVAHLESVVKTHSCDMLALEEVQIMLNHVANAAPATVKHLFPDRMDMAELHQVLRALLRERVSIRNLAQILERLAHLLVFQRQDQGGGNAGTYVTVHLDPSDQFFGRQLERIEQAMPRGQASLDTPTLVECLRQALAREICAPLADAEGQLDVATLAPDFESTLLDAIENRRDGKVLTLPAAFADRVLVTLREACRHLDPAVIVCDPRLRPALKRFTMRDMPHLHVLSHAEVHPQFRMAAVATIGLAGRAGN
jgi:hypothetical protein